MSDQMVQIYWSCGSIDEARRVSRYLVQEKLVACANIIPWVESVYLWEGEMHTEQETKVLLKTKAQNFDSVREVIKSNCHYEVPEISMVIIDEMNAEYRAWLEESVLISEAVKQ